MEIVLGVLAFVTGFLTWAGYKAVRKPKRQHAPNLRPLEVYERNTQRNVITTPVVKPKAPAAPRPSKPKPSSNRRSVSPDSTYDSGAFHAATYSSYSSSSSDCGSSSSYSSSSDSGSSSCDSGGSY